MKPFTAGFILLAFVAAATKPDVVCAGTINNLKVSVPHINLPHVTTPKVNNGGKATTSTNNNYNNPINLGHNNLVTGQVSRDQTNSKEEYDNAKYFQKTVPQATQKIWQSHGSGYQQIK